MVVLPYTRDYRARHGGEVCRYRRENGGFSCLPDSYYGVPYHVGFKSPSPPGVVVMVVVMCKGDYRIRGVNDGRNTVARYAGYRRENGGFMCSSVGIRGTVDHQMRCCRLRRSRVVVVVVDAAGSCISTIKTSNNLVDVDVLMAWLELMMVRCSLPVFM